MSCFMCPVCKGDLHSDGKAYTCKNNHSFDISKDGYVNLLMSQQSSLKRHGDDKLMVRSRRDFLNKSYYKALCDALCDCVKANVKSDSVVVDVGCGEGYYTNDIRNSFEGKLFGIDISKDALRYASKAIKNAEFSVASAFSLPFKNESADCIINIFAPSAYEDFYRVLKSDGLLIKAVPLENHLWDLKRALYDEPYKNKPEKRNDELFELASFKELEYTINVADKDDILNLFRMTPYYYKTGKAEAERLLKLDSLETIVHFGLEIYKKEVITMKYENNWELLNSRKVPEWFGKAKFGIFIHWGLYSIPAYAPIKDYAEWYGYSCNMEEPQTPAQEMYKAFHKEHYNSKPYYDFVNEFTGHRFDAKKWADLFKRSGAKYINFVSKHHDGYCLYETEYAPGLNSMECAPKRDFLMELKNAMEGTGVRFGVYHSVYEWWHPYYLEDPEKYALEHLHPMLKELVEKYQPNTLFTDGEWEHESSVWHSTEFLQWLYNESSVKDFIVPNDRWGKETRGRKGGNFTTEYGIIDVYLGTERRIDDVELDRPFEECRGIGRSFGINKEEGCENYLTVKELLVTLCSLVSKGGNFLLNIGPDGDGTIPPLMEERLLGMGKWLEVNGEAIYESEVYCKKASEGVYYTQRDGNIYAITEKFPSKATVFPEIEYSADYKASLLGSDADVIIENADGKLSLKADVCSPEDVACEHLYVFKLSK